MAKETIFPTLEEALFLHSTLIGEFGGARGVKDYGLLESALVRPRSGYYSSLSEQAAALMQSLAMNHPFFDGNKRMAFALTAVFLRLNGFTLKVESEPARKFLEEEIIAGHAALSEITSWIETYMRKR